MKLKFGEFLIEKGVIDTFALVQALNLQRRRSLIPIGEIALHDKLLSAEQILSILDIQENTGRRFGDIALELGNLDQTQVDILRKKQQQLHSYIGEIFVELNKISAEQLRSLLAEFKQYSESVIEAAQAPAIAPDGIKLSHDVPPHITVDVTCPICEA